LPFIFWTEIRFPVAAHAPGLPKPFAAAGVLASYSDTILLDFLKQLFSPDAAPQNPDWQPLRRTPAQERVRARWLEQQVYLNWAGPYFKAYHYSKAGITGQQFRVQLLEESGRQGAVLLYDPSIGPGNFRHFFDLLRDRV
jgi:hypothetical protein